MTAVCAMYFHSGSPDESSFRSDSDEKRKKRSQRVDTKQLVLWILSQNGHGVVVVVFVVELLLLL